jgi:xanthosine utilization system XapX-like protein
VADLLAHAGLAALTLLAWLGLGSGVLARGPRVGDPLLDLLNRVGAGALSFALLTFAAGWAGLLYRAAYLPVFAGAALAGAASCVSRLRSAPRPHLRGWAPWQLALLGLLIAYVGLDLLAVAAPISSPDALLYHAADPALFEKAHRIYAVPWNSSSYEPFSVEMLVLDGFLLWNPVQGAFAPLLLALVALAAVTGFAHRVAGRSGALLAGAIFFAQPFMVWETTSVFIESGIALAVALAAWNLFRFARHSEWSALVLAGVFAGGAAGMKYVGLIAALTLAAVVAAVLARRLTPRLALAFGLPALAVGLPWYVKNAVLTGNPFYPHLFGGLNSSASSELSYTKQSFGHGHGVLDFVLLPARLLADAKPFDGGQYLSPLFLVFAPVALFLRARVAVRVAWAAVLLYVVVWFVTTQQARFLVPLMPALAVLGALGILALQREGRLGRLLVVAATAGALVVGLGASTVYAAQFAPVVLGNEPEQQFLREKVSNYDGVEWLNRRLGPEDRVATDIWALFYLHMRYATFGTMGDLLPPDAGPKATRRFVAKYGITHIAILDGDVARRRQVGYLQSRLLGRASVRSVKSRTRGHYGRRHEMLVYAVER